MYNYQCNAIDSTYRSPSAKPSLLVAWTELPSPFVYPLFNPVLQFNYRQLICAIYEHYLYICMFMCMCVCVFVLPYISWFKAQFDFWVHTEKCNNLRITKQLCTHTYIHPWERICLYLLTVRSETRKNIGLADEMQIPWIWYEDCNMIHMLYMRIYYITFI